MRVRKAVVPAAGLGTRLLPASLSVPKELLPLDRKPAIHRIVEEAADAGIETVVLVLAAGKESVAWYFHPHRELRAKLKDPVVAALMDDLAALGERVEIVCVYQTEPRGLGHAVHTARDVVSGEPFALMLPDDHFDQPPLPALVQAYEASGKGTLTLLEVEDEQIPRYGIAVVKERSADPLELTGMVEKPPLADAPSNLAILGRYVLPPELMEHLENATPGVNNEIQITDSLNRLARERGMLGVVTDGAYLDLGTWEGYILANARLAGRDPRLAPQLLAALQQDMEG